MSEDYCEPATNLRVWDVGGSVQMTLDAAELCLVEGEYGFTNTAISAAGKYVLGAVTT